METAARLEKKSIISVDREKVVPMLGKVFIADDDSDYTKKINNALNPRGFETKTVNSFAMMEKSLQECQYPVNFIDNIEGNPDTSSSKTGSEIILERPELFRNGRKVVLLTGWGLKDKIREQLTEKGVEILQKGPGTIDEMIKICNQTFSTGIDDITEKTEKYFESLIESYDCPPKTENLNPYEKLLQRTKTRFMNYIATLPNPDTEQIYIMGKSLSPKQIMNEMEKKDSEIGILLIDMLLADVFENE
jgi:ActR/RegA family two-component response regulator